jgi:hypothetical protein
MPLYVPNITCVSQVSARIFPAQEHHFPGFITSAAGLCRATENGQMSEILECAPYI